MKPHLGNKKKNYDNRVGIRYRVFQYSFVLWKCSTCPEKNLINGYSSTRETTFHGTGKFFGTPDKLLAHSPISHMWEKELYLKHGIDMFCILELSRDFSSKTKTFCLICFFNWYFNWPITIHYNSIMNKSKNNKIAFFFHFF